MGSQAHLEDIRRAIAEADRRFCEAFNAGNVEGAARGVYTADALILPPGGEMVRGRDSIIGFWRGAAEQMGIVRVELATVEVAQAGEFAHQVGRATLTLQGGQQVPVKYLVIWKQVDGRWKWHIDIWNSSQA